MEMKTLFGVISVVLTLAAYVPYTKDVLQKKTRPHIYSWLVWAVLAGIAFTVQLTNNGGPGAWMMGFSMLATLGIFFLSLKNGEKHITRSDRLSLASAGVALALWFATNDPLLSIVLIASVDAVGGFLPTFRKSFHKPYEETISLYAVYAVSLAFSVAALHNLDLINALYPASFILINLVMVGFLWTRRLQLRSRPASDDIPEATS